MAWTYFPANRPVFGITTAMSGEPSALVASRSASARYDQVMTIGASPFTTEPSLAILGPNGVPSRYLVAQEQILVHGTERDAGVDDVRRCGRARVGLDGFDLGARTGIRRHHVHGDSRLGRVLVDDRAVVAPIPRDGD